MIAIIEPHAMIIGRIIFDDYDVCFLAVAGDLEVAVSIAVGFPSAMLRLVDNRAFECAELVSTFFGPDVDTAEVAVPRDENVVLSQD